MKLLIIGHGRHGKDTVAEMLRDYHGWTFRSSSHWAAEHVIHPYARRIASSCTLGMPPPSWKELYLQRHRDDLPYCGRKFWYDTMLTYNKEHGGAAIARGVLSEVDVYVGMRSRYEFEASMDESLFDHVIWVDRSKHLPPEGESMELTKEDADIYLDNNGSFRSLWLEVDMLAGFLAQGTKGLSARLGAIHDMRSDLFNQAVEITSKLERLNEQ